MKEPYIDKPITAISEDRLGRAEFAQNLANALCSENIKDGYTVGLYGSWGCGKTSLLNIIEKYIEQKQNIKVINFNPWLCDNAKQMANQFFKLLYEELKSEKKVVKILKLFAETVVECVDLNINIGLVSIPVNLNPLRKFFGFKNESLYKQKRQLDDMLKNKPKIVVMIDEIDRLEPNEILEMFRLVKSIADFPNVVYLLSFDREKVVQLLNNVNNSTDDNSYLEKIIQYPIDVPQPLNNMVWSYFKKHLMNCLDNYNVSVIEREKSNLYGLLDYGLFNLINNLRDSKRFLNTYLFNLYSIGTETNVTDLIGITALQVFAPNAYKRIQLFKDNILDRSFSSIISSNRNANDKGSPEQLFIDFLICKGEQPDNSSKKEDACRRIVGILFPIIYGHKFRDDNSVYLRRICAKCCFDRYFSLQLDSDSISSEDFNTIFSSSDFNITNRYIQRIETSNNLEIFLSHISGRLSNSQNDNIDTQIKCNIYLSIMDILKNNSTKYLDYSNGSRILNIEKVFAYIKPLIIDLPEDKKLGLLLHPIENLKPIYSMLIINELERLQKKSDMPETGRKIISDKGLFEIEKRFIRRIEELINNDKLWSESQLKEDTVISRLIADLGFINKEICEKLKIFVQSKIDISDSHLLAWFCHECVSKSTSSNSRRSWQYCSINYSDEYITFDKAIDRLKKYSETNEYKEEPLYLKEKFSVVMLSNMSNKENAKTFEIMEQDVINYMKDIEKMSQENDTITV